MSGQSGAHLRQGGANTRMMFWLVLKLKNALLRRNILDHQTTGLDVVLSHVMCPLSVED